MTLVRERHDVTTEPRVVPSIPTHDRTGRAVVSPLVVAVAWVIAWALVASVAPPTDPAVAPTSLELLFGNLALVGMVMTIGGLVTRSALGGSGAILGGSVFAAASVSCWATGHLGTWIAVQFAAGLALAMVGLVSVFTARRG